MIPQIICWISLPEIGYIVGIAVILFGCKAYRKTLSSVRNKRFFGC